jgi:hypothetical protein
VADTKKRTDAELLDAIRAMDLDDAADDAAEAVRAMSDEEVSEAILAAGGDPEAIGERGADLAAFHLERRARLAWQERAAEALARATAHARSSPRTPRGLPRRELLDRLAKARTEPRFAAPIAAAFRNRAPEESSDEELAALLDEIAILKGLIDEGGEGGDP